MAFRRQTATRRVGLCGTTKHKKKKTWSPRKTLCCQAASNLSPQAHILVAGSFLSMQTRDRSLFTSAMRETTGNSSASREQQPELNIAQRGAAFGANEAVRIAALNALSAARQKLGSLDKVTRVV